LSEILGRFSYQDSFPRKPNGGVKLAEAAAYPQYIDPDDGEVDLRYPITPCFGVEEEVPDFPSIPSREVAFSEVRNLSNGAVARSESVNLPKLEAAVGMNAEGAKALACVLRHEEKHVDLDKEMYYDKKAKKGRIVPKGRSNVSAVLLAQQLNRVVDWINGLKHSTTQYKFTKKQDGGHEVVTAAELSSRLVAYRKRAEDALSSLDGWANDDDDDRTLDSIEFKDEVHNRKTTVGEKDTFGLHEISIQTADGVQMPYSDYESYGDNEIRARDAESDRGVDLLRDWSFPGGQIRPTESYSSRFVDKKGYWQDASVDRWQVQSVGEGENSFVPADFARRQCFEVFKSDLALTGAKSMTGMREEAIGLKSNATRIGNGEQESADTASACHEMQGAVASLPLYGHKTQS